MHGNPDDDVAAASISIDSSKTHHPLVSGQIFTVYLDNVDDANNMKSSSISGTVLSQMTQRPLGLARQNGQFGI